MVKTRKQKNRKTKHAIVDRFREREARNYERPIASRECILEYLASCRSPRSLDEIAADLELTRPDQLDALNRRMAAMVRDGQVLRNRRGQFGPVNKLDLVCGRVVGHPDGFGFLVPDSGGQDLFLSARQMRSVLHGDRVVCAIAGIDHRGRREGAIVEVLEHVNKHLVGRFHLERDVAFVSSSNRRIHLDIIIPEKDRGTARDGQIVAVEIIEQPTAHQAPLGRVTEVLGDHLVPGVEIDMAIRSFDLPHLWPSAVEREIAHFNDEPDEAAKSGRLDLRSLPLVTIDGEDAKDFDDAVYCEPHRGDWRLLVAIADVSHYVHPATALDREGAVRGNSVYFPGRVIPMLPEVLSNGLCSLKPEKDRLCMVCELHISRAGNIRSFQFHEGVMRSHARLTYSEVAEMLVNTKREARSEKAWLQPHLHNLYRLYLALNRQRARRGTIEFDTVETRIIFDEREKIKEIEPLVRNDAHRIIEELMIAANIAAAQYLQEKALATLFRVHDAPPADKLADLRMFLGEFGLRLKGGDEPQPRHFRELLGHVNERPEASLIQTVVLRSMSQALYSRENRGHFGLALPHYAHFTSPIRRYPDLIVHRAIRFALQGGDPGKYFYSEKDLVELGEHCSMTEQRADDATRDAVEALKCEYMLDKIDQAFDATVSGVTAFGLFVRLDEIFVEGLVHITELPSDYYHFDAVKHRLMGERAGRRYRLNDAIAVRLVRVDLDEKRVDFVPANSDGASSLRRGRRKRKRS